MASWEIGLKYPIEIERHVQDIAGYLDDENPIIQKKA